MIYAIEGITLLAQKTDTELQRRKEIYLKRITSDACFDLFLNDYRKFYSDEEY